MGNESKRLASAAEGNLPEVIVLRTYGETVPETGPEGGVTMKSSTIKVVQIGGEQFRVKIPDVGKSGIHTPNESCLSELEERLRVPGRRAEIINLIQRVGERI